MLLLRCFSMLPGRGYVVARVLWVCFKHVAYVIAKVFFGLSPCHCYVVARVFWVCVSMLPGRCCVFARVF